jgi:hypothetical protein
MDMLMRGAGQFFRRLFADFAPESRNFHAISGPPSVVAITPRSA